MLTRPARHDDVDQIASWTQDTFDWGDYVAERLPEWLDNPAVRGMVAEEGARGGRQATSMGFRKVCDWRRGERVIGEGSPVPEGNGGRRVPPPERLDAAHSAEAEPAFLSWSTGELARAAHGLRR